MSKELVIGSNRHETKVAILEDDQLVEVFFQRAHEYSLAGSIHKGRVTRVLPGMQSAFVDLGLERDTFLYVSDFFEEHDDIDTLTDEKPPTAIRGGGDRGGRGGERRDRADRGGHDRDRPPQEISAAPVEAHAESLGAEEPAPGDLEEEEESENSRPTVPSLSLSSEVRSIELPLQPQARPGGERNDDSRGGDRGRRSRRRRRGGRDFPENKYARPNAAGGPAPAPQSDVVRLAAAQHQQQEDAQQEPAQTIAAPVFHTAPPGDVIVLPGESLAKYRTRPVVQAPPPVPEAEPLIETAASIPPAVEAELAEEAAEIKISDQVFSHQVQLPPVEAAPVAEQDDALDRAASFLGLDRSASINQRDEEHLRAERFLTDPSPAHVPPAHVPLEWPDANERELLAVEESLPELEDIAPEIEEALENGIDEPYVTLAEDANEVCESPAGDQPQSAMLRDQGNRSMHRGPRRMRRRRGGSGRFNNQSGPTAGGAAAPQGEPRPDSNRRDFSNQREPREAPPAVEERSSERPDRTSVMPSISELLKPGQEIIVQIAKEPLGQKGARITSRIALPGRYVVFMPSVAHLGVSRKVSSEEERMRLKRILQTHREGTSGGFIVRTAGEGVPEEEIAADMSFLYSLWLDIRSKAERSRPPRSCTTTSISCNAFSATMSPTSSKPSGSTTKIFTRAL